jgi:hypothetical protein
LVSSLRFHSRQSFSNAASATVEESTPADRTSVHCVVTKTGDLPTRECIHLHRTSIHALYRAESKTRFGQPSIHLSGSSDKYCFDLPTAGAGAILIGHESRRNDESRPARVEDGSKFKVSRSKSLERRLRVRSCESRIRDISYPRFLVLLFPSFASVNSSTDSD